MKKLIFFFVVLLSLTFVLAQPAFQQTIALDKGIQIESPITEVHKINTDFLFHIHAHNLTDGSLLTNATTTCNIHIFRPSDGDHIVEVDMIFSINGLDFDKEVGGGNFTEIGQYSVLFNCEIPNQIGGFFGYNFDVTATGVTLSLWDSLVRMFLIIFFVILLVGTYHIVATINFKRWNDNIIEKYKTRNFVKMVLSIIVYNVMNNIFIIYYLIGLPIIMILTDLTRVYNIVGLVLFMDVVLSVYIIGILIVGIVFLSYVQEWMAEFWDLIKDMDWGIEK